MKFTAYWILAVLGLCLFFSPQVHAIPVDLTSFESDQSVTVGPGNSYATITEDSLNAPVGLLNSGLDIPADALSLSFNYKLEVAAFNEDYFDFYFGDLSDPSDYNFGGYNNTDEKIIYEGTISEDLTSLAGGKLPIAFVLNYGYDDGVDNDGNFVDYLGSTLTISHVQINPVPEPATLLLLGSGLLGIIGFKKKKRSVTQR
jgi:hypothetical protein